MTLSSLSVMGSPLRILSSISRVTPLYLFISLLPLVPPDVALGEPSLKLLVGHRCTLSCSAVHDERASAVADLVDAFPALPPGERHRSTGRHLVSVSGSGAVTLQADYRRASGLSESAVQTGRSTGPALNLVFHLLALFRSLSACSKST